MLDCMQILFKYSALCLLLFCNKAPMFINRNGVGSDMIGGLVVKVANRDPSTGMVLCARVQGSALSLTTTHIALSLVPC